jgi:hypothetical protein
MTYHKDFWETAPSLRHLTHLTSDQTSRIVYGPYAECWPQFDTSRRHGIPRDLCPPADKVKKLSGNKLTPAKPHVIQALILLYNGVKPWLVIGEFTRVKGYGSPSYIWIKFTVFPVGALRIRSTDLKPFEHNDGHFRCSSRPQYQRSFTPHSVYNM